MQDTADHIDKVSGRGSGGGGDKVARCKLSKTSSGAAKTGFSRCPDRKGLDPLRSGYCQQVTFVCESEAAWGCVRLKVWCCAFAQTERYRFTSDEKPWLQLQQSVASRYRVIAPCCVISVRIYKCMFSVNEDMVKRQNLSILPWEWPQDPSISCCNIPATVFKCLFKLPSFHIDWALCLFMLIYISFIVPSFIDLLTSIKAKTPKKY